MSSTASVDSPLSLAADPGSSVAPPAAQRALARLRARSDRARLAVAFVLSLLCHALLLSLTLTGDGFGLPGFGLPWQERRGEAPDLRVGLAPAPSAAEPPAVTPSRPPEAAPSEPVRLEGRTASGLTVLPSVPAAVPPVQSATGPEAVAARAPDPVRAGAPAMPAPAPVDPPSEKAPPPTPTPAVIAVTEPDEPTWVVPTPPVAPAPEVPASPGVAGETAAAPRSADDAAPARAEVEARQEAAQQEAARQEAARQEAAQQEAARQEAARQEAARQEAARQEAARQEVARQEAARQEAAARREATLRAIGRQLDEEAARREAASATTRASPSLPPSSSTARRYRLFGRSDSNAEIIRYAEAWSRKIELNMTFDMVRDVAKLPHADPMVTVAVRSDGSVESVTFVVASGVPAIDEAIRRIVQSQAPYQAFPPSLARDYDVIEIRRTWYFDMAIRLY